MTSFSGKSESGLGVSKSGAEKGDFDPYADLTKLQAMAGPRTFQVKLSQGEDDSCAIAHVVLNAAGSIGQASLKIVHLKRANGEDGRNTHIKSSAGEEGEAGRALTA